MREYIRMQDSSLPAQTRFPTEYTEAARGLCVTSANSPKYPPLEH